MRYWVFQANPNKYRLRDALENADADDWAWEVNRHRRDIHPGDKVFVWECGGKAGIYAFGEVTAEPRRITVDRDPYAIDTRFLGTRLRAPMRILKRFNQPLLKPQLLDEREVANLRVIRMKGRGTNFAVTENEAAALCAMLGIPMQKKSHVMAAKPIAGLKTVAWVPQDIDANDLVERTRLAVTRREKASNAHKEAVLAASEFLAKLGFRTTCADYDILAKRAGIWILVEVKTVGLTNIRVQTMKAIGQLAYYAARSAGKPPVGARLYRLVIYNRRHGDEAATDVLRAENIEAGWIDAEGVEFADESFATEITASSKAQAGRWHRKIKA